MDLEMILMHHLRLKLTYWTQNEERKREKKEDEDEQYLVNYSMSNLATSDFEAKDDPLLNSTNTERTFKFLVGLKTMKGLLAVTVYCRYSIPWTSFNIFVLGFRTFKTDACFSCKFYLQVTNIIPLHAI